MKNALMMGLWRYMLKVPPFLWEKQRAGMKEKIAAHVGFMTDEHRLIHHYVVQELPYAGKPLSPAMIAAAVNMPVARVIAVLDDLEAHMTFLYRTNRSDVTWAYPVTVERTTHRVAFDTGQELYAA
ncbi:MAG: hypothetical protein PHN75_07265 [Syntrophales bacterium]|nr:hypothetical protein [Syntrophales bacterium]